MNFSIERQTKCTLRNARGLDPAPQRVGRICACEIVPAQVEIKSRGSGGKYLSVWITCTVHSGEMVQAVLRELGADDKVMMVC